ncbi:Co2+/Mg2+ efflux protein ApaG [Alloalcanivorax xenomutans]|jgi:ApaG protein|uniref:Co2+/Mg2+ efflux protein ApaG n=1 Tax=Alloalcanivorax xenomutans TaxID=1094342 RepID=UPI0003B8FFC2|nr:Co2+/Mg2+ efflux protein ApaG [Alloalcanivorax xenomutans]ERS14943.1 magnesium transporter ApaG [Alcanivorax sp. PN-3]MBA4722609.1 Co2+/Mg2+ efflux protein ApaG [Alcanivorax sp.]WOA32423.1 Co2+/Mg2+ efflux protein ApaG [Alloalcanivorax xenomutans]|tara:strand:+ start:45 stop:434 length:390 start_codon:yes stop_codon:yes gene_type:complete
MSDSDNDAYRIEVFAESEYLPEQSDAEQKRWAFAYHIRIINRGSQGARLLTRHWIITDGDQRVQEVHGEGVLGQQPELAPGQEFQYSSGAILETAVGSMRGNYQMLSEDGTCFNAPIPAFTLAADRALH